LDVLDGLSFSLLAGVEDKGDEVGEDDGGEGRTERRGGEEGEEDGGEGRTERRGGEVGEGVEEIEDDDEAEEEIEEVEWDDTGSV
jgi:hypothetical protein